MKKLLGIMAAGAMLAGEMQDTREMPKIHFRQPNRVTHHKAKHKKRKNMNHVSRMVASSKRRRAQGKTA